jgi:hypothetical protein
MFKLIEFIKFLDWFFLLAYISVCLLVSFRARSIYIMKDSGCCWRHQRLYMVDYGALCPISMEL